MPDGNCECGHHYSDHRRFVHSRIICEVNDCDCSDFADPIPDDQTVADILSILGPSQSRVIGRNQKGF